MTLAGTKLRLLALAILAVALAVALAGCRLTQPTRADLASAVEKNDDLLARRVAGQPLLDFAQARTAVLLNGRDWELREIDRDVYLVKGGDESAGTAAVLTPDGYLLTAAHCVSSGHVLAFVPGPGGFVPAGVRIVWQGDPDSGDGDFAVLQLQPLVPRPFGRPTRLSPVVSATPTPGPAGGLTIDWNELTAAVRAAKEADRNPGTRPGTRPASFEVRLRIDPSVTAWFGLEALVDAPPRGRRTLFVGMQPEAGPMGFGLFASAGRVRRVWNEQDGSPLRQIEFDGPIRPGFSGGPALDAGGRLLGVVHSLRVIRTGPRQTFRVRGVSPDPQWLADLIAADRARPRPRPRPRPRSWN